MRPIGTRQEKARIEMLFSFNISLAIVFYTEVIS